MIAAAFAVGGAYSTVPTPLYWLYKAQDCFQRR